MAADRRGVEGRRPVVDIRLGDPGRRHQPGWRVDALPRVFIPPAQPGNGAEGPSILGVSIQGIKDAQQLRERLVSLAAQHEVDEAEFAVQGDAHRPVAVAAAEQDRDVRAALLEPPGDRQARYVLHGRRAEAHQLRIGGDRLVDDEVAERAGVFPHRDALAGRVGRHPLPAEIPPVQRPREYPVAQAVKKPDIGHGHVVERYQLSFTVPQQEFGETNSPVIRRWHGQAIFRARAAQ